MRIGVVIIIAGIVIFFAAMVVLVIAGITFFYMYQKVSDYQTPIGQITRAFSQNAQNVYETYSLVEIAGWIVAVIGALAALFGAGLTVLGALLNKPTPSVLG